MRERYSGVMCKDVATPAPAPASLRFTTSFTSLSQELAAFERLLYFAASIPEDLVAQWQTPPAKMMMVRHHNAAPLYSVAAQAAICKASMPEIQIFPSFTNHRIKIRQTRMRHTTEFVPSTTALSSSTLRLLSMMPFDRCFTLIPNLLYLLPHTTLGSPQLSLAAFVFP